ncbi:helix-hairpin-helix domain-containing protein [Oscillatoria sp. FACHB-1407]|uniref:helix-hairpin-helix domain-containing protein n=1 Tax=Oscillatoria sp. FACHB-1407 TaxID=2692847 RepID=UPI001686E0A0|nr:helix-hairpin-helix domain-containing protein [Oscillatoria sp. FACHB-1407]MBD2464519.1 helix-hairpin-helix domain-containing protein [Oscillatoria sp. FACHB-1407]
MRVLRYLMIAITIACLAIGLNNCASSRPSDVALPPAVTSPAATDTTTDSGDRKININTAILSELDKLEAELGIPALSHQIQASRPYGSPADLVSKGVLTQEQFAQIQDQITVEEIVLTGEARDVDYLLKLGLMKGHMIIAGQLLELGFPDKAEPHLGHPVEEIYVDIAEQLPERGVSDFSEGLIQVQELVRSKPNDPQVQSAFEAANKAIDEAIAVLPAEQRQSPAFVLQVINGMLDTAAAEYTASISDGKITAEIEYQDSRGFVEYSKDTLFRSIETKLTEENEEVARTLNSELSGLFAAWPQPIPPTTPVVAADDVANQVKRFETTSTPVIESASIR